MEMKIDSYIKEAHPSNHRTQREPNTIILAIHIVDSHWYKQQTRKDANSIINYHTSHILLGFNRAFISSLGILFYLIEIIHDKLLEYTFYHFVIYKK